MKARRCECCGQFRRRDDIVEIGGEGDEWWNECVYCMSEADLARFYPGRTRPALEQKETK